MTPDDPSDRRAEAIAEARELGDPMTERDWDRWEQGPGWHWAPGYEPREK